MTTVLGCDIRWLIRRDMNAVLAIEHASFEFPWTEEEFLVCLRQRNCIGQVAVAHGEVLGFMLYELHHKIIRIINFCVVEKCRRSGIGRRMIQRLIDKLSEQRRHELLLEVRETNLEAQLFFAECGFRAERVLKQHYEDTSEDAYLMYYSIQNQHNSKEHREV